MAQIRQHMDNIAKVAPPIPTRIWDNACKNVPFTAKALKYERIKEKLAQAP